MDFRDAPHSALAFGPPPRRPTDRPSRLPSPARLLSRRHLQSAPRLPQALRRRPRAALVRRPRAAPAPGAPRARPGASPRLPPAPRARPSPRAEASPASPSLAASCRREAAARPRGLDAPEGAHSPRPGLRPARPSGPRPVRPRFPWVGNVACLALPHRLLSARSRRSAEGARCPRGRQLRAGGGAWAVDILAARAFSRGRALRPSPPVPPPIPDAAPR